MCRNVKWLFVALLPQFVWEKVHNKWFDTKAGLARIENAAAASATKSIFFYCSVIVTCTRAEAEVQAHIEWLM